MKLPQARYAVTADGHKYTAQAPGGPSVGPLRSVTGICGILDKPALKGWAARMAADYFKAEVLRLGRSLDTEELERICAEAKVQHTKKATEAADLGTACHAIFQAIIDGKEPAQIPKELERPAAAFKAWRLSTDIEIVAQELTLASITLAYGGRTDAVGFSKSRGGWGIVDYKTSSGFYGNEYAYQVAGYATAFEEQYGVACNWAEIARFSKKEPYESEVRAVLDMSQAKKGFEHLARAERTIKLPLIGEAHFSSDAAPMPNGKAAAPKSAPKRASAKSPLGF